MLKLGGRGARTKHVSHHTTALQRHFSRLLRHPWLEMAYSYPPRSIEKKLKYLKKNLPIYKNKKRFLSIIRNYI